MSLMKFYKIISQFRLKQVNNENINTSYARNTPKQFTHGSRTYQTGAVHQQTISKFEDLC